MVSEEFTRTPARSPALRAAATKDGDPGLILAALEQSRLPGGKAGVEKRREERREEKRREVKTRGGAFSWSEDEGAWD